MLWTQHPSEELFYQVFMSEECYGTKGRSCRTYDLEPYWMFFKIFRLHVMHYETLANSSGQEAASDGYSPGELYGIHDYGSVSGPTRWHLGSRLRAPQLVE